MANINDWREAFSFLRGAIANELSHAGLQGDLSLVEGAINDAFKALDCEIGNDEFDK